MKIKTAKGIVSLPGHVLVCGSKPGEGLRAVKLPRKKAAKKKTLPEIFAPFRWGEDSFHTEKETCAAISANLVDHLCNDADAGSVTRRDETYNVEVVVYLIDPNTGRRVFPK